LQQEDIMTAQKKPLAVITGATSGIGKAYAERLAASGYNLVITGRRKQIIDTVADRLRTAHGTDVQVVIADLSVIQDLNNLVSLVQSLDSIDILINNAGFGHKNAFIDETPDNIKQMIDVHASATVLLTHTALPKMIAAKKGAIIIVSSLAGFLPLPGSEIYSATKSFLNQFCLSLSMSVRQHGITVQALCPGYTRTDFHEKLDLDPATLQNAGPVRWMSSVAVVRESLTGLKNRNRVILVPGFWNKVLHLMTRMMPWPVYRAVVGTFFVPTK
jgi:uncharacterized protein